MKPVNQTERRNAFIRFILVFVLGMILSGFGACSYNSIKQWDCDRLQAINDSLIHLDTMANTLQSADSVRIQEWAELVGRISQKVEELSNKQREWEIVYVNDPETAAIKVNEIRRLKADINIDQLALVQFFPAEQASFFQINAELNKAFRALIDEMERSRIRMESQAGKMEEDELASENEALEKKLADAQNQNDCEDKLVVVEGRLKNAIGQLQTYGGQINTQAAAMEAYIDNDLGRISLRDEKAQLIRKLQDIKNIGRDLTNLATLLGSS